MEELRRIQQERYEAQKRKEKEEQDKILNSQREIKVEEFKKKLHAKYNSNPLTRHAIPIIRAVKRHWFNKRENVGKDWFRLQGGSTITVEEALQLDFERDIDKERQKRLIRLNFQQDTVKYWQDREFEASSVRDNPSTMGFFELECVYNFPPTSIAYYPFLEEWSKLFPMIDMENWIYSYTPEKTKEEDNEQKLKRLYRLYNNIQNPQIEIEISQLINKIKSTNQMLEQEPTYNNRCAYCDTTREDHWVYAFNRAFQVCRPCAYQIHPSQRTAISSNRNSSNRTWAEDNSSSSSEEED